MSNFSIPPQPIIVDKNALAAKYNCQPEDIDVTITQDEYGNTETKTTVKVPLNIDNFEG